MSLPNIHDAGRFRFADVPAGYAWRHVTAHGPGTEGQSEPREFAGGQVHQLTLIVDASSDRDQVRLGTVFSQAR